MVSASRPKPIKPPKPRPDFPLFAHGNGQWAKKIRGRLCYFGAWADPDAALAKYLDDRADLQAGRTPATPADAVTVADLCNRYLASKEGLLANGEIAAKTFRDMLATARQVTRAFGRVRPVADLAAADFGGLRTQLARRRGPVALANEIQRVRSVFKWGFDAGLLDRPVRFGPGFRKPSRRVMRKARREAGPRLWEPAEVRAMLGKAGEPLRTMILLGVNGGFGAADCAALPRSAVRLDADGRGGWVEFPRPKTEAERRFPLWPETAAGLRHCLDHRRAPKRKADADAVFLTYQGHRWVHGQTSALAAAFGKFRDAAGLKKGRVGFYGLRRTFRTYADEVLDPVAVGLVMGHVDDSMAAHYRERIGDDRLRRVTDHVRAAVLGADDAADG